MDASQGLIYVCYAIVALFALGTILSGFFQVRTAEAVVIQRMGKFLRVATAGMNFKLPWLDQIASRIDLRVQQLALDVETKTQRQRIREDSSVGAISRHPGKGIRGLLQAGESEAANFFLCVQRDTRACAQDES